MEQPKPSKYTQFSGQLKAPRQWPKLPAISTTTKKRAVIAGIILVAIGMALFWIFRPKPVSTQTVNDTIQRDLRAANNGSTDESIDELNKLKTKHLRSTDKQAVLEAVAVLYSRSTQGSNALVNFEAAEKANKKPLQYSSYATMANLYAQQKDNTRAIVYYQKAIAQLKNTNFIRAESYQRAYEDQIKKLEAAK